MAGGWRGLLEEESEHQWLTLCLFAVFVVFGAFAIDATEHFVGDQIVNVEAQHKGGLVTEIEYQEERGAYSALFMLQAPAITCLPSIPMGRLATYTILKPTTLAVK